MSTPEMAIAVSCAPQCAVHITALWKGVGLPDGVLNIVTASCNEAEILLRHPAIEGITFVGSTSAGRYIHATAISVMAERFAGLVKSWQRTRRKG